MAEYIENVTNAAGGGDAGKIKTPFAKIIVGGTVEKPCYSILYFDTTDGDFHIGWSSYCLEYVRKWFAEEFEIDGDAIDVDIAPVVHGRWVVGTVEPGYFTPGGNRPWVCSECNYLASWMLYRPTHKYCPNCGARMDGE